MDILQQRFKNAFYEPPSAVLQRSSGEDLPPLSEQTSLLLTMIDILPFLDIDELKEWLSTIASNVLAVNSFNDSRNCRARFWEVLNDGEMDFKRAAVCGKWWNTEGGRHSIVLLNHIQDGDEYTVHRALTRPERL